MFCQKDLVVLLSFAFVLLVPTVLSKPQVDDTIRFSRLLNQKPELLRHTSISNVPSTSLPKEYRKGVATVKKNQPRGEEVNIPRDYLLGEPKVSVRQSVREESSSADEGTLTNINQKPISGRAPVTVLRQSSGNNRLNISPVFTEQDNSGNRRRPLVENVTEKREEPKVEEIPEITTINSNYEEAEDVTTQRVTDLEEEPAAVVVPAAKPEVIFPKQETVTFTTLFDNTTGAPAVSTTTQAAIVDDENFLADHSFHRKGNFPDFEDSPSHLVTAESSQPARVNVRPASSGKDYEYEYIYYYYDDDDEDNSTSSTPKSEAPIVNALPTSPKIEVEASRIDNFSPEKIQPSKLSSPVNTLERSRDREPKTVPLDYETPVLRAPQRQREPIQEVQNVIQDPTTEFPEAAKLPKPVGSRPILLKQSNLVSTYEPSTTTEFTSTTTERQVIPSSTTEVPVSRQAGPRFRNKERYDTPKQKFTPESEVPVSVQTEEPPRRSAFKESLRRNPTRRPLSQQPQVEEPVTEYVKPSTLKVKASEDQPRPSSRTRFPPRAQPTSASSEVENSVSDVSPSNSIVDVTPAQISTLQPNSIELDDKKKENFARTKSINDLYALTRLHQLAINTRIPNRKSEPSPVYKGSPPKFAGGFISSSSEGTTQYPDEHLTVEASTITAFIPPSFVTSQISTTTEQASTSSLAPADEHFGGKRNRGFRGRLQKPTQSTTTEATSRPSSPNRFGGRRRNFTPSEVPSSVGPEGAVAQGESPAPSSAPAERVTLRQPNRHRFAGRTRQPSSTTPAAEAGVENVSNAEGAEPTQASPPRRQRPQGSFGQNRRRPTQATQQTTSEGEEAAVAPSAPAERPTGPERRRPANFAPRTRPTVGGAGPIVGRPLRLRKTTSTTTEASEPVATQENGDAEQSPTVNTEEASPAAPVRPTNGQKVTVLSTTTILESPIEPTQFPKRGSAAVLGRLRPRAKSVPLPTTVAPDVTTTSRKPSRLNGILNRKKLPLATTAAPVVTETHDEHEESHDNGQEQLEALPKGTIVQVSTIVTESEETPEHGEIIDEHVSSTTQGSILNRLKSQRKPGSLFRKRVE